MNQKAKQVLQKSDINNLQSLPHVLLRLLSICHDESLSYSELTNILKKDPALYIQFYSMLHQGYNFTGKKNSLKLSSTQLFQQLSVSTIKSIAVTTTVRQFFSRTSQTRTEFLKRHWQSSLYCAYTAEAIAKLCKYQNPDEAYTAGLLHGIGQLALEANYGNKYTAIHTQASKTDQLYTTEHEIFETTHQQVGAELLKKHGINNFICDAVLYHHERAERILDAHPLVKITFLANALTCSDFDKNDLAIFNIAEQLLGVKKPPLLEIIDKSQDQLTSAAQLMAIHKSSGDDDSETIKQKIAADEFKRVQIAEQVRNIALLDGAHQQLSRSVGHGALLDIISQQVCLLFGISHSILFLYDAKNNHINAVSDKDQAQQFTDFSIPLISGRSLISDSLLNKQITHSFNYDRSLLSIIDRQLIDITQQKGIICLPMIMNNVPIGIIVLGTSISQHNNLNRQHALLMRFVNETAHTISVNDFKSETSNKIIQSYNPLDQKIREALHEVRNPLSIMNNYLDVLSYKLKDDETLQNVRVIKSEVEHVAQILKQLIESDKPSTETSAVDVNAILSSLTTIFQTSLLTSKKIQIFLDLDKRIESLQSNANAIKQIYTNLIVNAVEALPTNGQLMVYTQADVNIDGKLYVEISIADNGPGIDAEILPHLFSPVKTTKGGGHAGLGLTIVKNLVNELQGSINCRSNNKGCRFQILLPKLAKK